MSSSSVVSATPGVDFYVGVDDVPRRSSRARSKAYAEAVGMGPVAVSGSKRSRSALSD
jgi:hypothetical protein